MADTAAHLVDRVLPEVPIRQWVLTLPYPLRYRCAWNARLTSEVLRCFLRAVFADQRRRAKRDLGIRRGLCGSVTFIQRFGSALNLAPHFHTLVLDGVYPGTASVPGPFAPLPPPETEDVARVLAATARRILRQLERKGITMDEDSLADDDPLMAMLGAASIRSRIATGPEAGDPWRRLGDRVEPGEEEEEGVEPGATIPPRCVRHGGMSLHADVAVPGPDRRRLERLCRYVARPPLALDHLEAMTDGRLAYRLKTPWRDGTTHVVMERKELLERLAPLIPPPRAHQVRYHGVLAPCASGRDRIVPGGMRRSSFVRPRKTTLRPSQPSPTTWIDGPNNGLDDRLGHGAENVPLPGRFRGPRNWIGRSQPRLAGCTSSTPSDRRAHRAPAPPHGLGRSPAEGVRSRRAPLPGMRRSDAAPVGDHRARRGASDPGMARHAVAGSAALRTKRVARRGSARRVDTRPALGRRSWLRLRPVSSTEQLIGDG